MSIANNTENNILKLIFNAVAWANYADNAAATPETNISVALATADPGETGTMSTSEATYSSYARVDVARTTGGWTVTNNSVSPAATINFPASTAGTGSTITHFSAGKTGGGTKDIIASGTVTPNIATGTLGGVTPQLTTTTAISID